MLMASLITPSNNSLFLFSSRSPPSIPISSKFPLLPHMIHSSRQHPVVVKEKSTLSLGFSDFMESKGLFGCSTHFLLRNSCFGESVRRRCSDKGWGNEEEGDFALENEILDFMDGSENPNKFPTKKDLINAGRIDLVEAIEKNCDWLSKGWDLQDEIAQENDIEESKSGANEDLSSDFLHSDDRIFQERCFNGGECDSLEGLDVGIASEDDFSTPSSSGREMGKEDDDEVGDAGIHGILKRLEKERNFSFGLGFSEKETDTGNDYEDGSKLGSSLSFSSEPMSTTSLKHNDLDIDNEASDNGKEFISDFDDTRDSLKPNMWRAWSTQWNGLSQLDLEAAEIGMDNTVLQNNANETGEERTENVQTDENWFRTRVKHLESELASTLRSLKSAYEIDTSSLKGRENLSDELLELSDAWEFQETEVMNAKNKLRSVRAKLAILEGKMTLATIESQKNLEMKQKRINDAQLALSTLRTACIVWPNSNALVVLVCGSFDGWTSQRTMERSGSGFFTLNLMLYPGRYEFKFIVDGEWKIDPLRPIARTDGYENNVMVLS